MPCIGLQFRSDFGQVLNKYKSVSRIQVPLMAGALILDAIKTLCSDGTVSVDIIGATEKENQALSIEIRKYEKGGI